MATGSRSGVVAWTRKGRCPSAPPPRSASRSSGGARSFAPGGGFVFNAIHNIQAGTPVENIVAMLDAVREFNGTT